jgi:hypothetical protein
MNVSSGSNEPSERHARCSAFVGASIWSCLKSQYQLAYPDKSRVHRNPSPKSLRCSCVFHEWTSPIVFSFLLDFYLRCFSFDLCLHAGPSSHYDTCDTTFGSRGVDSAKPRHPWAPLQMREVACIAGRHDFLSVRGQYRHPQAMSEMLLGKLS